MFSSSKRIEIKINPLPLCGRNFENVCVKIMTEKSWARAEMKILIGKMANGRIVS